MTVAHDGVGERGSGRSPTPMFLAAVWLARGLLTLLSLWFFAGLVLGGGDTTFVWPGALLAVPVVASFRWPEVAPLAVVLLFGFSLFLFVAMFLL